MPCRATAESDCPLVTSLASFPLRKIAAPGRRMAVRPALSGAAADGLRGAAPVKTGPAVGPSSPPDRAPSPGLMLWGLLVRRVGFGLGLGLGLGAGAGLGAAPTLAQSAPPRDPFEAAPLGPLLRDDVAGARRIPGYTPPGLEIGGVHIAPALTMRAEASSNMFNRPDADRGDLAITLAPAVLAVGSAGPARFVIDGQAGLTRYARLTGYNHETWSLRAQGVVPVAGGLSLAVSGAASRVLEPPFEAAGANAGTGGIVLVDRAQGSLGARADLGRTRLTAMADILRSHYLPAWQASGLAIGQSYRDERMVSATLRIERALGPHLAFAEGAHRWVRSLHPGPAPDRSATAGEALVGLRGELGHLMMAEVAAGYQWRAYRSAALRDYRGAAWRARVEWYATPLVTFTLAARRDIANSALPEAAGVVVDSLSLKALYEVKRNLNLVLSGTHAAERYRDLAGAGAAAPAIRSDAVGLEAQYATGRHLTLGLAARYRDRRSGSSLVPRQGHAVEGGLTLRFSL